MAVLRHNRLDDGAWCLESELLIPRPREEVFSFFQDAYNLEQLTPEFLRFQVLTPRPVPMHTGARIDYRLRLHGIPIRWQSEIAQWDPPHGFEDRQLKGPYKSWHHTHRFLEQEDGTLCTDRVVYRVLGGPIIQRLFVARDVEQIFHYRAQHLRERFG